MKILFQIKHGNETRNFDSKEAAKAWADEAGIDPRGIKFGPDHWKYGGAARGNPCTHSHTMNDSEGDGFRRIRRGRK